MCCLLVSFVLCVFFFVFSSFVVFRLYVIIIRSSSIRYMKLVFEIQFGSSVILTSYLFLFGLFANLRLSFQLDFKHTIFERVFSGTASIREPFIYQDNWLEKKGEFKYNVKESCSHIGCKNPFSLSLKHMCLEIHCWFANVRCSDS